MKTFKTVCIVLLVFLKVLFKIALSIVILIAMVIKGLSDNA